MHLVELADDIGRDTDERAQRCRGAHAVLPSVPGRAEDHRHLLEVVHEEALRVVEERLRLALIAERVAGKEFLQFLRQRRLGDTPAAHAEQLDLARERRILALAERADHVVRRGESFVPVQLAARQADEVRCVEPRVLGVDRHEHLDDVVLGQPVENDGGHGELVALNVLEVGVQRQQPVLAVDGAQDALTLRHLQAAHRGPGLDGFERQLFVARDDDGARNRRQVSCLAALLVVLHQLVDLLADDVALVRLLARRDPAFEQVPVHLRRRLFLASAHGRLPGLAVVQHLEAHKLVDVAGGERRLIELHPELLHTDGSDVDHGSCLTV